MKLRISITLTVLSLLLGLGLLGLWLPPSTSGGPLPALQGEAALNHLKEQELYGSLQEAVTAARYGFYQESKQSGDRLADNHAQRLRASFTPDGLQVETGGDGGRSHRLGMKLRNAGYGERQMAVSAERLSAKGARIEYEQAVGSGECGGIRSQQQRLIASDPAEMVFTSAVAPGHGSRPFIVALQGHANPTPTEDPCVLVNTEAATGSALGIGQIAWASREVVNLCSNAEGAEVEGEFTITAANGDQLFGVYQTLAQLDFESNKITAHGRYRIVGGTGTFDGASGEGIIAAAGSLLPPFEFSGVLLGRVSF